MLYHGRPLFMNRPAHINTTANRGILQPPGLLLFSSLTPLSSCPLPPSFTMDTWTFQDLLPHQLPVLYASHPLLNAVRQFIHDRQLPKTEGEALRRGARNLAGYCAEIAQRPDQPVDFNKASLLRTSFVCLLFAVHDLSDSVGSRFPSMSIFMNTR